MGTLMLLPPLALSQIGEESSGRRAAIECASCCRWSCGNSVRLVRGTQSRKKNHDRYLVQGLGRSVALWENKDLRIIGRRRIVVRAGGEKKDNNSGDDQVETLFMRELRRRGMTSGEGSRGAAGTDTKTKEEISEDGGRSAGGWSSRTRAPPELTEAQRNDQLKRSMALNSEGLDGLIPRARELLKLGGTSFLVFWPFILASLAAFLAVYLYFGTAFVHTGNSYEKVGRPPYVDPYQLLEEEVLPSGIGPDRVPFNFRPDSGSP